MEFRVEQDYLGKKSIPYEALYGIHAARASENFPYQTPFHFEWYKAIATVKLAYYQTCQKFKQAALSQYRQDQIPIRMIENEIISHLIQSAEECRNGQYFEYFIVPAISGGAGTSINMNINKIIANASLVRMGKKPGDYQFIDPVEHANVFQSTNDVIPTSLKLVTMQLLDELEASINGLRTRVENIEKANRNSLRIAYTQMQEAVPGSFRKLFSTYSEALSRDWWRISKFFERIKVVNLGGSAIGTGITVPRFFIFEVVKALQQIAQKPLTRAENLEDATANIDPLVEIHAILKSHAVNLEKMASDIRALASDLHNLDEIKIPQKQVGSSIMPGKINPVISEFVISCCHRVYSNDQLISSLAGQGFLDLNAYLPIIGHALIESIKCLIASDRSLSENLFPGLAVDDQAAKKKLFHSQSITTALIPYIGYHAASKLAQEMQKEKRSIFTANKKLKLMTEQKLQEIFEPQNLLRLGFSLKEIV